MNQELQKVNEEAYDLVDKGHSPEVAANMAIHRFLWNYAKKHGIELNIVGDCSDEYILDKIIEHEKRRS